MSHEALYADGFEDALIGLGWQCHQRVAVYDMDRCIEILVGQGMSYEEAVEFFHFNVVGTYAGPATPIFVSVEVVSNQGEYP
jgi:hypothetical protein